jgi:hypothetical protein
MDANTRDFEAELEALQEEVLTHTPRVQADTEVFSATAL